MRRRRKRGRRLLLLLLILALGLLMLFRSRFDPVIRDLAVTQVKNQTSDLINDAVSRQIAEEQVSYDRIIYFEKDLQGRITALKTNMSEVNRLKTEVLNLINREILALDTHDIGLPLGSILLPELFSGKGPVLPVRILSVRNSDAAFTSHFSEAGINQTLHRLNMEVSVDVTILVLAHTETFTVTSQVAAAETIIVGTVPETFLTQVPAA